MKIIKNNLFNLCIRFYLLTVLFLYTYSQQSNGGELYFRQALIMLYVGVIIYLFYCFVIKKYKILKSVGYFDISMFFLVHYILFTTILYDKSFVTNLNLITMIILIYMVVKTLKYETVKFGIDKAVSRYEFLFTTFIFFIFLSTVVEFINTLGLFTLFPLPVNSAKSMSWFNNSSMYTINIGIAIMFCMYKLENSISKKSKVAIIILISWFSYWVLMSAGRTGIITLLLGVSIYVVFTYKQKVMLLIAPIILLFFSYDSLNNYLSNNFFVFERFSMGGIGERDVMFFETIDFYSKQNIINQLFGSGTNSFKNEFSNEFTYGVHSGLLKIIVENGLIFILIYFTFISFSSYMFLVAIKRTKNSKQKRLLINGLSLTIFLFVGESMDLMTMTVSHYFPLILLLAAIPAIIYRKEKNDYERSSIMTPRTLKSGELI